MHSWKWGRRLVKLWMGC